MFVATNGITLASRLYPDYVSDKGNLYVKAAKGGGTDFIMPLSDLCRVLEAVGEYNTFNNKDDKKDVLEGKVIEVDGKKYKLSEVKS